VYVEEVEQKDRGKVAVEKSRQTKKGTVVLNEKQKEMVVITSIQREECAVCCVYFFWGERGLFVERRRPRLLRASNHPMYSGAGQMRMVVYVRVRVRVRSKTRLARS
jgi:hypothetical protein